MIKINNLRIKRGQGSQAHTVILDSMGLQAGEILAITGASGCGKSTLLESIGLLLKPESLDEFLINNDQLIDLSNWHNQSESYVASVRAKNIGFILQSGGLIPYLNVKQNILLPRKILNHKDDSSNNASINFADDTFINKKLLGKDSTEHIEYAIHALGVENLLNKKPSQLSIGERQRVAFIRAISHKPKLLLADEPTAALDPIHAENLFTLFKKIVTELNISAIVVSHDWQMLERFGLRQLKAKINPGVCEFV